MNNFNLRKFLTENKLTASSKLICEQVVDHRGITWNYPDVESEDFYYEPTEDGYYISLKITGVDNKGNKVEGLYNTTVPVISQEVLDDLDIDPNNIDYPVENPEN